MHYSLDDSCFRFIVVLMCLILSVVSTVDQFEEILVDVLFFLVRCRQWQFRHQDDWDSFSFR